MPTMCASFFLAFIMLLSVPGIAQVADCKFHKDSLTNEMVVLVPEKSAEVVGGLQVLGKAVSNSLKLQASARTQPVDFSGVYLVFLVDDQGNVKGERVIRNTLPETPASVFKAIKTLSWKPATCNGKPVSSIFTLPIRVCLSE